VNVTPEVEGTKSCPLELRTTGTDTLASSAFSSNGGDTHTAEEADNTLAGTDTIPNLHEMAPVANRFVPDTVTALPPLAGPKAGEIVTASGSPTNSNTTGLLQSSWLLDTDTFTEPTEKGGDTHTTEVYDSRAAGTMMVSTTALTESAGMP